MGNTCLDKITNITATCIVPQHGVKDLYLMYPEDVTFTYSGGGESVLTAAFASGAKSYRVEGYKQNIQITSSLRSMDASAKLDISVAFKVGHREVANVRSLLMGKFYVMAVYPDQGAYLIGVTSPLECSSAEFDSNANSKLFTITLNAPEGSAGNNFLSVTDAARSTIISKSV